MQTIPYLQKGDLILIVAPAKAIELEHINYAKELLEQKGYQVEIGKNCTEQHNYFSGTDLQRVEDLQWAIDHPNAKAILCARGGYGTIRLMDYMQWASQLRNPKWIIGFSDITVLHQYMQKMELPSLHATMPLNFQQNTSASLQTLLSSLEGKPYSIQVQPNSNNNFGHVEAEIIGGNLSILYSLIGTDLQPNYKGKILFIEDVGEQLYAVDRMLHSLKRAGIFDEISGLLIGGMTDIKDTTSNGIGFTFEELLLQHFQFRKIPIAFNIPAGHIDDNQAIPLGQKVQLDVNAELVTLSINHNR